MGDYDIIPTTDKGDLRFVVVAKNEPDHEIDGFWTLAEAQEFVQNLNDWDLHVYAQSLPSQGGVEIGPWLEQYASEVPNGSAIVELGSWLGAGTAHLALGAMKSGAKIHVYDRFVCASEEEQAKAATFGVKLELGEDTLPRVKTALAKFPAPITYIKNSFKPGVSVKWDGPIGLYVDDLTKVELLWMHAMNVFKPHFIPEKTILVLQDYNFDVELREQGRKNWENYSIQRKYMAAHAKEFELILDELAGTTAAIFRFNG